MRPAGADDVVDELERIVADLARSREDSAESASPPETSFLMDTLPGGPVQMRQVDEEIASRHRDGRRWLWIGGSLAVVLTLAVLLLAPRWMAGGGVDSASPVPAEPSAPHQYYDQGIAALRHVYRPGSVDRAWESFQRAIALDADYAPAYSGLARACWERYRESKDSIWLEQAMNNVNHALQLSAHLTSARVNLGLIQLSMGNTDEARREFEGVIVLDPDNFDAYRGLGDYYRAVGEPEAAEASYRRALELRPESVIIHSTVGVLNYQQGRYREAETAFRRSIEIDPNVSSNYRNLAAIYHMQDRYAEAAQALQKALEIRPEARVYSNLGTLYFFQGLYQQALSAYLEAIDRGGNDFQLWGNLGDAYRWTPDNTEKAKEAFRTAIQLLQKELDQKPDDRPSQRHACRVSGQGWGLGRSPATACASQRLGGLRHRLAEPRNPGRRDCWRSRFGFPFLASSSRCGVSSPGVSERS